MIKQFSLFCGVDVSKEWIDVAIGGTVTRLKQNLEEIKSFIKKQFNAPPDSLVVLESTGGYEQLAAECFDEAGIIVHIAHPNKVRDFAKAKGRLAKTDRLDALTLCEYAQFIEPSSIRPLRCKLTIKLNALNSRLIQLKELHQQEVCRMGTANVQEVKETHKIMLDLIKEQLSSIEKQMRVLIKSEKDLQEKYERLQTVIGVGPTVALALIAGLPELGNATKKEIAALVGVAPITKDSGKLRGRAITQNGRAAIRKVLYMGAVVASRHDKKMKEFYTRLINKGKAKKIALVAVMRKMLITMNAMLAQSQNYRPTAS
jgi:transposase